MNLEKIKNKRHSMILRFAIPSIIAMVLSAMVTLVDGYFIGNHLGKNAITAVNLGLPIVYFYLALAIMVGVGGVSIAGRFLGSKETHKAIEVFNQTIFTTGIISIISSIVMALFFTIVITIISLNQDVIDYMKSYYYIMFFTYSIMILNIVFGMFIRGEGNPEKFMKINVLTVILNIVLDYVFISVLDLGMKGIAFASLIAVSLGFVLIVKYFKKDSIVFKFSRFTFSSQVFKETLFNGSSEFIGQVSQALSMTVYNLLLLKLAGINGIAAFTIIGYSAYVFNMVVIGFGQGASPLISFTFGAKDGFLSKRIRNITFVYVTIIGLLFYILLQFSSEFYASFFVRSDEVQMMIVSGIKILPLAFIVLGINVIASFYFTSIGKAKESAIISSLRGLFILMIALVFLPRLFGIRGVWLVGPITEGLTLIMTLYLLSKDKIIFPAIKE